MAGVLHGQVAIVTGGGRGIGRAIAEGLAGAGAAVGVVARSAAEVADAAAQINSSGGRAAALVVDVRDQTAVEAMVHTIEAQLGLVDLLVNNAGTGAAIGPTWEVDPDEWWKDVEVILRGTALCSRAVLGGMVQRGHGRIVNITSRAGAFGSAYQSAYSCSRAALFQLTDALAKELKPHGIQVFALTPGVVRTALTEHILNSAAGQRWLPSLKALVSAPNAWVDPKTVAAAVVALAAGRGDALSGRWIHAADDLDALVARAAEITAQDSRVLRLRE